MHSNVEGFSEFPELFCVAREDKLRELHDSLLAWVWRKGHGIVMAEPTYLFVPEADRVPQHVTLLFEKVLEVLLTSVCTCHRVPTYAMEDLNPLAACIPGTLQ